MLTVKSTIKSTVKENIARAVQERNSANMGRIADRCRFEFGMNYDDTFLFFKLVVPNLTIALFDSLLMESECEVL